MVTMILAGWMRLTAALASAEMSDACEFAQRSADMAEMVRQSEDGGEYAIAEATFASDIAASDACDARTPELAWSAAHAAYHYAQRAATLAGTSLEFLAGGE